MNAVEVELQGEDFEHVNNQINEFLNNSHELSIMKNS